MSLDLQYYVVGTGISSIVFFSSTLRFYPLYICKMLSIADEQLYLGLKLQ